jgi:hypothetical protein
MKRSEDLWVKATTRRKFGDVKTKLKVEVKAEAESRLLLLPPTFDL